MSQDDTEDTVDAQHTAVSLVLSCSIYTDAVLLLSMILEVDDGVGEQMSTLCFTYRIPL